MGFFSRLSPLGFSRFNGACISSRAKNDKTQQYSLACLILFLMHCIHLHSLSNHFLRV